MSSTTPSPQEMTELLAAWSDGDREALDRLLPLVEGELHRLAHHDMSREREGHTLQTSALVNEAYLKLCDQTRVRWQNRAHFFAIAAQTMRRILIDHARSRRYEKRGGGARALPLDEAAHISDERADELVALDDALAALDKLDPRKARVVELRYFGGLSVAEAAEALGISTATVMRDWDMAKAWLARELGHGA